MTKPYRRQGRFLFILLALIFSVFAACSGGGGGDGNSSGNNYNPWGLTTTGPGVLSVSPLDTSTLVYATPLGKLSPPGHVLATDHVYLSYVDPWNTPVQQQDCRPRPIYAAGAGVVYFIMQTETAGDTKVMIQMTKTFWYFYDHVFLLPNIKEGTRVLAGEQIGTTTGRCPSIDLGVYDLDVTLPGLIKPERYGDMGAHAVSPYKYFTSALQAEYYSKVRLFQGVPVDKDGKIDYGVRGRLAGDWFHSSIANASSSVTMGPEGWGKTVSFAKDWFDGKPRISIGGTITTPGVVAIDAGAPDPATVGGAQGLVVYETSTIPDGGRIEAGWLLVQMTADDEIKIEYFAGAQPPPTGFTTAAQKFVR